MPNNTTIATQLDNPVRKPEKCLLDRLIKKQALEKSAILGQALCTMNCVRAFDKAAK